MPFKKFLKFGLLIILLAFLGLTILIVNTVYKAKRTEIAGERLFKSIIENNSSAFAKNYASWQENFSALEKRILIINKLVGGQLNRKYGIKKYFDLAREVNLLIPEVVAENSQKTYFILLQNDREIRPSGGFIGSYAKLRFELGGLKEVHFQDIYVPDGQIVGHVEPPWPIQEAFKQGWWKLRDSNWDPDFPQSAKIIDWFFQKGGEEKADGIIAVNFSTVQKLLQMLGSFYLPDYNQTIDADNLYQVAQSYSEIEFFPGSTQKKDVISGLGRAFLARLKELEKGQYLKILSLIYQSLEERQILLSFTEPSLATAFGQLDWDGSMKALQPSDNQVLNDYLYLVETNLGANKANCCVERKVSQEVEFLGDRTLKEKVVVTFKNNGQFKEGIPPFFWGGTYVNFFRIYFPQEATLGKIFVAGEEVNQKEMFLEKKEDKGLTGIGFFVKVPAQEEKTVEVTYEISLKNLPKNYHLTLQKQPGIVKIPYRLTLKTSNNLKTISRQICRDEEINLIL